MSCPFTMLYFIDSPRRRRMWARVNSMRWEFKSSQRASLDVPECRIDRARSKVAVSRKHRHDARCPWDCVGVRMDFLALVAVDYPSCLRGVGGNRICCRILDCRPGFTDEDSFEAMIYFDFFYSPLRAIYALAESGTN